MKNTGKCPKCGNADILFVEGKWGAYGSGPNISAGLWAWSSVQVDRFVCRGCGYLEHWVHDANEINKLAKRYG